MKIVIHQSARDNLTPDEYKFLLLLEFNKKLENGVLRVRNELGITIKKSTISPEQLSNKSLELTIELNIPINLFPAITNLIYFGEIHTATQPILVLSIENQLNRMFLYSAKILPKPTINSQKRQSSNSGIEGWYSSNKDILYKKSIAPATPLIQINKFLTKPQLHKAINDNWKQIEKALRDFKKSMPYPAQLTYIPIRELEESILIYRYKNKSPSLTHAQITKKLKSHKIFLEEQSVRKRYSEFGKLLKSLGFVSN